MEDISNEIEKFSQGVKKASNYLSIYTDLRASDIRSNSKILDVIYSSAYSPKEKAPSYLLRSKPVELPLEKSLFIGKLEISTYTKKPIKLTYVDTLSGKKELVSETFFPVGDEGLYKILFTLNAPVSSITLSTVEGEVNLRRVHGFVFRESGVFSDHAISLSNHIERLNVLKKRASNINAALLKRNLHIEEQGRKLQDKESELYAIEQRLTDSINSKKEIISSLDDEISTSEKERKNVESELSELNATLNFTNENVELLEQTSKKYKEELSTLKKEVRDEDSKLKRLQRDVDVFSEDLKAYTGETRRQQVFYGLICVILLGVLVFITTSLFERAENLIINFEEGKINNIWDVLISRVPFMFAVLGIVTFIAEGMRRCINEVIAIHDQRLAFLRLSIVAREVVETSTEGLDIDKKTIAKERVKLKLTLLRHHMEKDLGSRPVDFKSDISNVVSMPDDEDAA